MKRISNTNFLIAVISLILVLAACSKGTLQITDDASGIIPASNTTESSSESADTDTKTDTETQSDTEPEILGETEILTESASETTPIETSPDMSETDPNQITLTAQGLLGVPFVSGGQSPDVGFDSSGFIYYVLKENGYVNVSRIMGELAVMGTAIDSPEDLKSGDLVFFSDDGVRPQFGGIYIGDGIMISCSMPGDTVKEIDITNSYYLESFYTGVRVL